jgi:hypothetical protein
MNRKQWDKLWGDLSKRCEESDFDWKAQKKWIERRVGAELRRLAKVQNHG